MKIIVVDEIIWKVLRIEMLKKIRLCTDLFNLEKERLGISISEFKTYSAEVLNSKMYCFRIKKYRVRLMIGYSTNK